MNARKSEFLIYGVAISLSSNNAQFEEFIHGTLQNYIKKGESESAFQIHVSIQFDEKSKIKKSRYRVGNGVYFDDAGKKVAFDHKLFRGEFAHKGKTHLQIRGEITKTLSENAKQALKGVIIKNYSYQEMLFHQLYRELILMPVFWILRHKFDKYLTHASAVSLGKECFVFLGNDGVGKTTIALNLLQQDGALFFGDNFLLYDFENIYSFVDTLRVNKTDVTSFFTNNDSSRFTKVFKGKSRIHYNYNKNFIADHIIPTQFHVLVQGKGNVKKDISEDEFVNFTYGINNFVKEFDKFSFASTLMYLFKTSENVVEKELKALKVLIGNNPCFLLQLNKKFEEHLDVLTK